jgi:hypothetical protein
VFLFTCYIFELLISNSHQDTPLYLAVLDISFASLRLALRLQFGISTPLLLQRSGAILRNAAPGNKNQFRIELGRQLMKKLRLH